MLRRMRGIAARRWARRGGLERRCHAADVIGAERAGTRRRNRRSIAAIAVKRIAKKKSRVRAYLQFRIPPLPFTPLILPGEVRETICRLAIAPARLAES